MLHKSAVDSHKLPKLYLHIILLLSSLFWFEVGQPAIVTRLLNGSSFTLMLKFNAVYYMQFHSSDCVLCLQVVVQAQGDGES